MLLTSVPGCSQLLPVVLWNRRVTLSSPVIGLVLAVLVVPEGVVDTAVPHLVAAIDASGVDAEEDVDAVSGAAGDLRGRNAGIEGERDTAVPEVVRPGDERRGDLSPS
ncbi:hypothetical protein GCM10022214_37490 [Actinomadura miaoliensis]|uniref:AI-2E family transporter n=1 Tax=Actinomadura miaoliensis TaxID=430685 RepID=A0ABP7VXL0_9ACTN